MSKSRSTKSSKSWLDAITDAIHRQYEKYDDPNFTIQTLVKEEGCRMIKETNSVCQSIASILSRILQAETRKKNSIIKYVDSGTYALTNEYLRTYIKMKKAGVSHMVYHRKYNKNKNAYTYLNQIRSTTYRESNLTKEEAAKVMVAIHFQHN